jgi:3-phosphoshikimate 1-carboxyvinyltransferase
MVHSFIMASIVLKGKLQVPGDKSISHRAVMLLSCLPGTHKIQGISAGQDVKSTQACFTLLGTRFRQINESLLEVTGMSHIPRQEEFTLHCGNSGTTMRLLTGLLSGMGIKARLIGDSSLTSRPMKRATTPLSEMGAWIISATNGKPPLILKTPPDSLSGIEYQSFIPSAQVKSAILLAGLYTKPSQTVSITEPLLSRDHTERMLNTLGAGVHTTPQCKITLEGRITEMRGQSISVPGDISSAAFWMVAAAIVPGSEITIENVGLNPTRTGILKILHQAGVHCTIQPLHDYGTEPVGNITVYGDVPLKGDITIEKALIPSLVDEIPILSILGLFTEGTFTLKDAGELRVKESDRLKAMADYIKSFGVPLLETEEGYSFTGDPDRVLNNPMKPFETYHDHRLVMALMIASLKAKSPFNIEGKAWADISYPGFAKALQSLHVSSR